MEQKSEWTGTLDFGNELAHALAENIPGVGYLRNDNVYFKMHNGEWIGKPSVQTKDLKRVWFEEVNPEDIDTRYYNLDGTHK